MNNELLNKMNRMSEQELYNALYTDELTGILNRSAFNQADFSAMAIIDLDSLKYLNDEYGHRTGDKYLKELGHLLMSVFGGEFAYRISGDEFVVTGSCEFEISSKLNAARKSFPGFSYGVGGDLQAADELLAREKASREQTGKRSARGEAPPWINSIEKAA